MNPESLRALISRFRVRADARPGMTSVTRLAYPPESQIRRVAAFALGLGAVSRYRVIGPWLAPVGGPFRRPDEIGRARKMLKRPCAVIVDIADETKFSVCL